MPLRKGLPIKIPSCSSGPEEIVWDQLLSSSAAHLNLQTSSSRLHRFSSQIPCEDTGDRSLPSSHTTGHNTQSNNIHRRSGWGMYRRRYINLSEHVSSGIHPSSHQQQDGDFATGDPHVDTRVRYMPYAHYHRRAYFQKRNKTHVKMEREQNPPETKMEKRQDETSGTWFKIIIPFGIKYDEKWLLNLIQEQCSIPFTPVKFHYEKMQAQFFVENASVAFALKNVNGKIQDEDNEMISIFVNPSDASQSVQKELKSEKEKLVKVKLVGELDQGKGLEPEDMSANGNPLCTTFPDNSTNISSILELFPKLLCLDDQEPPPATNLGIEEHKKLPTCKGSFFGSEALKNLVLQFLQQFYMIYDSGDRHYLLNAYHDGACFSLTIPFNPKDPNLSSLFEYFKNNRNMKNLKDPNLHFQLLKHTKHDIMCSLCVLPKTQHDFNSFVVDMCFQSESMLCFCVNGVFKEVEGQSQGCVRAFTRTFIATPASSSSLCIMNDELFVRDATPDDAQSVYSIEVPNPTFSFMPTLSKEQQEMVQVFSIQSGMSLQCSQKCLHGNHRDYTTAVLPLPKVQSGNSGQHKYMMPEEALPQADP
ncbi:nuclear RNA export factor 3 [Glossophaga mutica]